MLESILGEQKIYRPGPSDFLSLGLYTTCADLIITDH